MSPTMMYGNKIMKYLLIDKINQQIYISNGLKERQEENALYQTNKQSWVYIFLISVSLDFTLDLRSQ